MEIGSVYIDTNTVVDFVNNNSTSGLLILVFGLIGWIVFVYLFLFLGLFFLAQYKADKLTKKWQWVLLAVDVPTLNLQTPKAVEQMFSHLAGAYDSPSIGEKFRHGYKQKWFSFEIISMEGYIQFLIRTEIAFRDLVEASIYAQYPDAEITEVEDYVSSVPDNLPDENYDMWGGDFGLAESFAYPIRTYMEFEHKISKDDVLKDPMGTLLESFSRVGQGEQLWLQILVEPTNNNWKEKVIEKIKAMVGDMVSITGSKKKSGGFTKMLTDVPAQALSEITKQIMGGSSEEGEHKKPEKKENVSKLSVLTPGQKKLLEAMENKITKIGFKTKMRTVYVARKEVFKPQRSVNALIGAVNQFNIPSANSLILTSTVGTEYFWKTARAKTKKRMMMAAYKKRRMKSGGNPFVFNIEELATIWHFPMSNVRTPMLQKAEMKHAEPPSRLPIESIFEEEARAPKLKKVVRPGDNDGKGDVGYSDGQQKYG